MEFDKHIFIHHVYFWLAQPANVADRDQLVEGLSRLSVVDTIHSFHIGRPADTSREVIDSSYAVSWLLFFKNKEDQDSYQDDPMHLRFIDECSHLWDKVLVYDTVGI